MNYPMNSNYPILKLLTSQMNAVDEAPKSKSNLLELHKTLEKAEDLAKLTIL